MTISDRIFERLKKTNMSQKAFSECTGISQSTISEWKSLVICEVLGVTPEWLLSGADNSGTRSNELPWFVIDRNSELGIIVETYHRLDESQRERLKGYMEALTEMMGKNE